MSRRGGRFEEEVDKQQVDPYRECVEMCRSQGHGRGECHRRCQQEYRRGGRYVEEEENDYNQRQDPYRECQIEKVPKARPRPMGMREEVPTGAQKSWWKVCGSGG